MESIEVNLDGLVGPTHNYSGLSFGNLASTENKKQISNPREAALQGLDKMHLMMHHGIPQIILPPHERPSLLTLRQLGFYGTDEEVISKAFKTNPEILFACSSSSYMWAANAATVSPSIDSEDNRVHITVANLIQNFHRSIESVKTEQILKNIFPEHKGFIHHGTLPLNPLFSDEGAANHTRLCSEFGKPGIQLFVFGQYANQLEKGLKYPARTTFEAVEAIFRLHRLKKDATVFAKQSKKAIDAGVFHNDVISVGNQNFFLFHEEAFEESNEVIDDLVKKFRNICKNTLILIKVKNEDLSLEDAVRSYLFNSQIVTLPGGEMMLLAPTESLKIDAAKKCLDKILKDPSNPIARIEYLNLHESMCNGGGPACLRLRVVLNKEELKHINPKYLLTEERYLKIKEWIYNHYRDRLAPDDLKDPLLYFESQAALSDLNSHILR